MFFPTDFPQPIPSFQRPVALVLPEPDTPPFLCVKFNAAWLPYVLGCLLQLQLISTWDTQDDAALRAQLQRAMTLMYLFQSVNAQCALPAAVAEVEIDFMDELAQVVRTGGKCLFQYRCCVDDPWVTLATIDDLQTSPPGTGNQPAPGGGTADYCRTLYANQTTVIPTPVSTGDTITIESATGSWSDNGFEYFCIDGNDFFIACTGVGAAPLSGTFLPSAPFMSAIVKFSTGYYALYPGATLTVPAGVTNEQPLILANKATLALGSGTIDVCVRVTNNKIATWAHDFDFTISPGGFDGSEIPGVVDPASWTAGVGWVASVFVSNNNFLLRRSVTSTQFTLGKALIVLSAAPTGGGFYMQSSSVVAWPTGAGDNICIDSAIATVTSIGIFGDGINTAGGHTATVVSAHFEGTGANPFV